MEVTPEEKEEEGEGEGACHPDSERGYMSTQRIPPIRDYEERHTR